ncbi:MAG: hypothetical protein KDC49_01030 [Saprospiraceae bacterium]|nr:hypothetical protein [Saprospiraceae bacterium]
MIYPDELLPKKQYKYIDTDLKNHHLIRTVSTIDCLDENGFVGIEYIASPRHNLSNLSVHILSVFDYKHLPIVICGDRKAFLISDCDDFSEDANLVFGEDFILQETNWFWILRVGDLQDNYQCEIKGIVYQFAPTVIHCPTRCNFWHYEIRWTILNSSFSQQTATQQKKINDAMYAEARKTLQVLASSKIVAYERLKAEDYSLQ